MAGGKVYRPEKLMHWLLDQTFRNNILDAASGYIWRLEDARIFLKWPGPMIYMYEDMFPSFSLKSQFSWVHAIGEGLLH